jgi:CO dehydrogenase/acetyl-CoA synthase epsilon subunit
MPIEPFFTKCSPRPEIITLMAMAFEKACRPLHISGQTAVEEIVAKKIIELAQKGERDPVRMSEQSLKSLRMKG